MQLVQRNGMEMNRYCIRNVAQPADSRCPSESGYLLVLQEIWIDKFMIALEKRLNPLNSCDKNN